MRIEREIKKSGYFWRSCTPDQKAPGTLSISDGGIIKLEVQEPLNGKFDNRFEDTIHQRDSMFKSRHLTFDPRYKEDEQMTRLYEEDKQRIEQHKKIEQIIGDVGGKQTVILNNCYYEIILGAIGEPVSLIRARTAFISLYFNKANFDKANYNENRISDIESVTFSIERVDEWVGISGIKTYHESQEKISISYQRPKDIPIKLKNDMQLLIEFWETEGRVGGLVLQGAGITQKTRFKLISQKPRKLEEFIPIIDKIATFLCFFTCQTVSLNEISINPERHPINIYYQSRIYSKDRPIMQPQNMLLRFQWIKDDTETLINNWIEAYKEYERAFDLYFSTKTRSQMPLEDKFLALARGLEIYYRTTSDDKQIEQDRLDELIKLCKNQCNNKDEENFVDRNLRNYNTLSLGRRIEKMIKPFKEIIGGKDTQEELAKKIAHTRHKLTHAGTSLEKDLQKLYLKTESIFQLLLLQSIGFNQGQINNIVWWHPRLKRPFLDY